MNEIKTDRLEIYSIHSYLYQKWAKKFERYEKSDLADTFYINYYYDVKLK